MKSLSMIKALVGVSVLALSLGMAGCGEEGAGEQAGKKADQAAQDVSKAAGKAAEDLKKTLGK